MIHDSMNADTNPSAAERAQEAPTPRACRPPLYHVFADHAACGEPCSCGEFLRTESERGMRRAK